jgi:hypothetical protein
MAANIFSKEGMRRFKQGFLESIGVANSSRELDTEFEQYVSRFTSAGTNVGNLHDRLKSYIRSQEELSNASAGVFSTLSSVFSALPSGLRDVRSVSSRSSVGGAGAGAGIGGGGDDGIAGSSLMGSGTTGMRGSSATTNESLTAQLQMCAAAHELQSETVFNPSKKYFQRELLRPLELLSKKVSKISAVVTKCRGLYVDVDAFQHKVGVAQKKGNTRGGQELPLRPPRNLQQPAISAKKHVLASVASSKLSRRRKRKAETAGEEWKPPVLSCRVCHMRTVYYCVQCRDESNTKKTAGIFAVCGASARHSRKCFATHAAKGGAAAAGGNGGGGADKDDDVDADDVDADDVDGGDDDDDDDDDDDSE